ncbi:4'-phosphopantetheinyl transferase family protein [Pseudomarimonas salicorniae]|uniref:4'-phosphopantetheinyl transferase superfamily protein n=1 Tax=Pseudomarimonas salicorniae TaxID=2933270 RepID=A0ABT0GHF4_9GAMM|nr:4'-phosphopantetheinyl transferase superfamily protein [Lysobacter sp. CAU 1642]MCK7593979.1 4'-phosphopantetheinyl transferase superfamily protein [Lysobacter sp. CAU 1642]
MSLSLSLYRLDEVDSELRREALGWLEPDQRQRAGRFATELLRQRFVAAQARLRQHLAERLGREPGSIVLRRDEHGKPRLASAEALHFSLSHSGGWAMVAAAEMEVGVDLEAMIDPARAALAGQFLDAEALSAWQAAPADRQAALLTLAWCAREAVLKLDGRGLTLDARTISLPLGLPARAHWEADRRSAEVIALPAPAGYRACLASPGPLALPDSIPGLDAGA